MSTEDINSIKKFLKFQKMHKNMQPSIPIQGGLDSKAYKLIITRVNGLRRPQNPQLTLQFSIAANLFIQNQGEKCFFGRTYNSPRINVEFGPDGVNYEHIILPIYYHTRILFNKDVPLYIILELQAFETQQDLVLKRMHLGWCEIQALQILQNKLNLRKGSPRILLLGQQINFESSGVNIVCEVQQSDEFQMCMYLTPENALCGYGDELPGLRQSFVGNTFELQRTSVVFMSKIQVLIPESLEMDIFKQVQKYRSYKYRTPEDYRGDIQIINKRLIVTYHNGWTYINQRGLNNFVPLADTRYQVTEFIESKQIQFKQLAYQGVIDISNVCSTDPTVNSGILIVQLEYEALFLVSNVTKETMQLILGWMPIYINNKFGSDEQIDDEFIIGSGKTLDGRPLVSFSNQDLPIKIKGSLNLSGGEFQVQDLYKQPQLQQQQQQQSSQSQLPQQQSQLPQQQQQQYQQQQQRRDLDGDLRSQVKLKDIEHQLLRLQEENERLRRLALTQQQDPQKQQEYLQAIEKLREENRVLQFTQANRFEGLEKLIKEQKVVEKSVAPPLILQDAQPQNVIVKPIDSYAYPVPQATLKPISRNDLVALVDEPIALDHEKRLLELELQDERKDSIIVIQPVSIKQFIGTYPICKSLQLGIIFYDMPTFKTPYLNLEYYNDERNFKYNIESGNPLRLLYNNESFNCKFNVETSLQRYINLETHFAQYLLHKNLIIDIWDSESQFLFGSVRIPLKGILRSGKHNSQIMSDVEIFDPQIKKVKGTLQIVIKNIGKMAQQDMSKTVPLSSNGFQKKKLVIEKPVNRMEVPAQLLNGDRIQDRIKLIKKHNLQEMSKTKQTQQRSLNEVLKYKEIKKPELLRTIMQSFLSNERVVHSFYGKSEIIPFYFKNTYPKAEQFIVNIEDPESRLIDYQEFFLLGNPAEWKYWVTELKQPEPENYDMIRMKENQGKTQYYFILDPNQEITLLFKFISFRQYDIRTDEQEKTPEYIRKYMQQRYITIMIQHEGKMMEGMRLVIEPHQQPIDQILRFYERENRQTRLIIPRLFNQPIQIQPRIHITDSDVMIEWSQDFNSIRLNLRIGDPQSVKIFNILLYHDQYQHKVIANWKIEVYSLSTNDIEVPLGQKVATKITFPCDITRSIKLSSSNKMISFIKPFDSEVQMLPGKINLVPINILALQDGKHLIKLNGVDIHSQELIYSWLINVHATPPLPSATYDLRCIEGRESRHQVNYQNQVNYTTQYNLVSSSDYVKLLEPIISTGPKEMVQFKIRILPGCEELVRIFLNDIDERIFDVIVLNVKYVY